MTVRLRGADLSDISTLRDWDAQPDRASWAGTDGPWDWDVELPREVDWQQMFIAEFEGTPIGFLQLLHTGHDPDRYWGSLSADGIWAIDLWIGEQAQRGIGLGSSMMRLAIERLVVLGAAAVLVDPLASNDAAHRFYRRHGFSEVGRYRFGDDDCLVLRRDLGGVR